MSRHWMPMYWSDYLADTQDLTTEEHGAYLLLIGSYWTKGRALPDDDKKLAAIAKQMPDVWLSTRRSLEQFFEIRDGYWFHPRIEAEIKKANEISEKRSRAGSKGASKKKAIAKQMLKQNTSIPQPPITLSIGVTPGVRSEVPDDFQLTDETRAFCQIQLQVADPDAFIPKFKELAASYGWRSENWQEHFKLKLRDEKRGNPRGGSYGKNRQSRFDADAERLDEFEQSALAELQSGNPGTGR